MNGSTKRTRQTLNNSAAVQRQTAVTAYLKSKQLLLLVFEMSNSKQTKHHSDMVDWLQH